MKETIQKALNENKRVYVLYVSGIYKGQIVSIKNMHQFDKNKEHGDFKIHDITTDQETLNRMIKRA